MCCLFEPVNVSLTSNLAVNEKMVVPCVRCSPSVERLHINVTITDERLIEFLSPSERDRYWPTVKCRAVNRCGVVRVAARRSSGSEVLFVLRQASTSCPLVRHGIDKRLCLEWIHDRAALQ